MSDLSCFRPLVLCTLLASMVWGQCGVVAEDSTTPSSATQAFEELLDTHWEWRMQTNPLEASYLGDSRYDAAWPDLSPEAITAHHEQRQAFLKQARAIDPQQLSPANRINWQLFTRELEMEIEGHQYGWYHVPLTQRDGIQTIYEMGDAISFDTADDYRNWITRLETFPTYMDQTIELMRAGVEQGIVQSKVVMQRLPGQIRRMIVNDPTTSLMYKPLRTMPSSIPETVQQQLRTEAQQAIAKQVVPSYEKFLTFFTDVYYPACFEEVGVRQIPRGQEFYAYRARLYTTTDLTPRQIHEIGLSEVARIRAEMQQIMAEVKFDGSFREFLEFLRTDPQFYFEDPNELFEAVQATCKKVDPQLVKLFKTLPRMPYGVEPIPDAIAPDTTAAYYRPPAADGSRAGSYFYNLYQPNQRPKYTIEVLSLHEAVPGHHLQIALAMELEDLPAFRRFGGYTAFIEGWGLYSESLGDELGLYQDPYSRFGQLTYEMWRAIRLVVDTGMHSLGWTRQQAIDLFLENTAKSRLDIENEVDRYIAWPGQALAYKIGQLRILDLRREAEQKLGDQFDVREFHEVVLGSGAVTLDVLDQQVRTWIQATLAASE